jgi:penicillin-binding protein 1A
MQAFRRSAARQPPRRRPPRTPGQLALAILKWTAIAGLGAGAILGATLALMFWRYGADPDLPQLSSLADYQPKQVTRVLSADGHLIGEIFDERRTFVPLDRMPDFVPKAFIAAEDANFFQHRGIDYVGMLRAVLVNLRSGRTRQGASTITQQVVKTFLLSPERTFRRKMQEIILARRLESELTKEEILALYINQIYFGHGRYGVQEAARFYFGKDVGQLTVGEAALLGGLPQAPENISPRKEKNRARAKQRQIYVLDQMVKHKMLSIEEAAKWAREPIQVVSDPYPNVDVAPEWMDIVRRALAQRYGADKVDKVGVTVKTTMDLELQRHATQVLRKRLRDLDARHRYGRPLRRLAPAAVKSELARLARKLPGGGPVKGERYRAVVLEVFDEEQELVVDLGQWRAAVPLGGPEDARYNQERRKPSERFRPGDLIEVSVPAGAPRKLVHGERAVMLAPGPEGAVVVIEARTRKVLALVGGHQSRAGDFNRATMARRQPGSAFKPFVYAAAIDRGAFTAASVVNDAPEVYELWRPKNFQKGFEGPVRLRHALARSINTVAIRVLSDIGAPAVIETARRLGISSELPQELSLALGSGVVTPLELTNAFASFAAGGQVAEPTYLTAIGNEPVPAPALRAGLRPEVAYIVLDMMRSVVEEGTATPARAIGLPLAGKTGTSNDARDAWFVGISPSFVVGVWIGFDDNRSIGAGESGGKTAVPVFVDVMQKLARRERSRSFTRPAGVVEARIDRQTGLLAAPGASVETSYPEVFVDGTVPVEVAPAPGQVDAAQFMLGEYDDGYGEGSEGQGAPGQGGAPQQGAGKRPGNPPGAGVVDPEAAPPEPDEPVPVEPAPAAGQ